MNKFIIKTFIFVAIIAALWCASQYYFEVIQAPVTAQVAVKQFDNSNTAYENLRTSEIQKNWTAWAVGFIGVILAYIFYNRDVKRLWKKGKQLSQDI